jgi:hypothetical protein
MCLNLLQYVDSRSHSLTFIMNIKQQKKVSFTLTSQSFVSSFQGHQPALIMLVMFEFDGHISCEMDFYIGSPVLNEFSTE